MNGMTTRSEVEAVTLRHAPAIDRRARRRPPAREEGGGVSQGILTVAFDTLTGVLVP